MGGEEGMRVFIIILILLAVFLPYTFKYIWEFTKNENNGYKTTYNFKIGYLIIGIEIIIGLLAFQNIFEPPYNFYICIALPFINLGLIFANKKSPFFGTKIF